MGCRRVEASSLSRSTAPPSGGVELPRPTDPPRDVRAQRGEANSGSDRPTLDPPTSGLLGGSEPTRLKVVFVVFSSEVQRGYTSPACCCICESCWSQAPAADGRDPSKVLQWWYTGYKKQCL